MIGSRVARPRIGGSWTCRKEAEVASLMKKVDRVKHSLTELRNRKEEELRNISTEHEEELQKLKVQLAAAKEKSLFPSVSALNSTEQQVYPPKSVRE